MASLPDVDEGIEELDDDDAIDELDEDIAQHMRSFGTSLFAYSDNDDEVDEDDRSAGHLII